MNAGQASFFDWSSATTGFVSYGTHIYGIDLQPMAGTNGSTSAIRLGNDMTVVGRNAANTADVPLIGLNSYNNVIIGGSGSTGVFINEPNLVPSGDNTTSLGLSVLRWQQVWAVNGAIQTSDASLKTDITPLPPALPIVASIRPISFKWIEGGHDLVEGTETQLVHATEEQAYETVYHEVQDGKAFRSPGSRRARCICMMIAGARCRWQSGHGHCAGNTRGYGCLGAVIREAQPGRTPQTHRVARMIQRQMPVTKRVSRPGRRNHWVSWRRT